MAIKNEYNPKIASHPGRMLLEEIKSRDMTQKVFAERTGLTEKHLSEIVNGKAAITPEVALKIEAALGTSASLWLRLQMQYDEVKARVKEEEYLQEDIELLGLFPYNDIRKVFSDLPNTRVQRERVISLRQFFCYSSLKLFSEKIHEQGFTIAAPAFRTTGIQEGKRPDEYALASWIRIGELKAQKREINKALDCERLEKLAADIAGISAEKDLCEAWEIIRRRLNECGVKTILVPYLPKTYVNGAVYWEGNTPVIILNARSSYWDTFIFTLLHEIGHIIKHGKNYRSVSFDKSRVVIDQEDARELEADEYAEQSLIDKDVFATFASDFVENRQTIDGFAAAYGIDRGIVAARLARKGILRWQDCVRIRRQLVIS